ncbi:hypothetical protein [Bifidobacterium platyrrhinorum]|uniref:Uncharacterized protein n=1 Tax=Bifidobacterium platyrrhinorum TaxID=2661628 RepID=A0A6L9SW45_9BIFI|nr:hypothetical protein [Bifidobacterium platyrrhinorum]NEG55411.1 hypothetical protein [Bifidobacterium platyrrhinorum]
MEVRLPERCKEVPITEAEAGMWAKFTLDTDILDDDMNPVFIKGRHLAKLCDFLPGTLDDALGESGIRLFAVTNMVGPKVPLFSLIHGEYKPYPYVSDLRVYRVDPVTDESTPNERVARIEDIQVGDWVLFGENQTSVSGFVTRIKKGSFADDGTRIVRLEHLPSSYLLGGENGFDLTTAYRFKPAEPEEPEEPVIPEEPGYYEDDGGNWWVLDGRSDCFVMIRDRNGKPWLMQSPVFSRDRFTRFMKKVENRSLRPVRIGEVEE